MPRGDHTSVARPVALAAHTRSNARRDSGGCQDRLGRGLGPLRASYGFGAGASLIRGLIIARDIRKIRDVGIHSQPVQVYTAAMTAKAAAPQAAITARIRRLSPIPSVPGQSSPDGRNTREGREPGPDGLENAPYATDTLRNREAADDPASPRAKAWRTILPALSTRPPRCKQKQDRNERSGDRGKRRGDRRCIILDLSGV